MVIHGGLSNLLIRSNRLKQANVMHSFNLHAGAEPVVCNRFQNQRGAYAIEFALVFPLFFLVVYATLTYGLIFTAQQSMNYAAESGARAALSWPGSGAASTDTLLERAQAALNTAVDYASWVDAISGDQLAIGVCKDAGDGSSELLAEKNWSFGCSAYTNGSGPGDISVVLRYPYRTAPLIPMLGGSLMGFAVPDALTAVAQANLHIAYGASAGG